MIAVRVSTAAGVTLGGSSVLFEGRFEVDPFGNDATNYDVGRDGRRFLMVRRIVDPGGSRQQLNVVIHWFEDVKTKMETK